MIKQREMARRAHAEDYDLGSGDDEEVEEAVDEQYFESYGVDINVTRVMIADEPRMRFYDEAIRAAGVAGKVVVDVGAGTGVLSMMAARAGAKRVIAIEASAMAVTAQHVIRANGYSQVVRVVNKRAEDVTLDQLRADGLLEADEGVDFIVSEWMGFYLLHENMLPSVLAVRDNLGCTNLIPSSATIYAAPVDLTPYLEATSKAFWRNCGGFDLSVVGSIEEATLLSANPLIAQLPPACVLCEPVPLWTFSLGKTTIDDLRTLQGSLTVDWKANSIATAALVRAHRGSPAAVWGLGLWFTVEGVHDTAMPSGPMDPPTHWKQSVVLLPEELRGQINVSDLVKGGDSMRFDVELCLNPQSRSYEIALGLSDPNE